jgi:hypothetical protein
MIKKRYLEMMKEILDEYSEKIDGGFYLWIFSL